MQQISLKHSVKENNVAGISIGSSDSMLPKELKSFTKDKYTNVGELGNQILKNS